MVSFLKEQDIDEDSMNDNRRIKMEKQFDDLNKDLIKKADQEVLEISSTGYGLESVSKETEEDHSSERLKNHLWRFIRSKKVLEYDLKKFYNCGMDYEMENHSNGITGNRQKLAQNIFQEVQSRDKQSSKALLEVLNKELNNLSDTAIEIRMRQNERLD